MTNETVDHHHRRVRFGTALILTIALVGWLLAGTESMPRLYVAVANVLGGLLLLATVWSTHSAGAGRIVSFVLTIAAFGAAISVLEVTGDFASSTTAVVMFLVALFAPTQISRRLIHRGTVDGQLVFGALTIYMLIGVASSMAISIADTMQSSALFIGPDGVTDGTFRDHVYFAFVTLTTTGYGDFTPYSGSARAIAILTSLVGQLYLVTAVAAAVSQVSTLLLGARAAERSQ